MSAETEPGKIISDFFKLEKKKWHIWFNHSILELNDTDTYKVGTACGFWEIKIPHELYYKLSDEMIDND